MSQLNLFGESFLHMPSLPNLNNTLMFIETNKYLPFNSAVSFDKNVSDKEEEMEPFEDELSLEIKMEIGNHETISSASNIKKKKVGCTCKKTKCLKLYCECFSSGKMCTPECSCYGCFNDEKHLECLLKAKQTLKSKSMSASKQAQGKGCNCKKSQCQKKYCECYNAGLACGESCKCEDCANGDCRDHENLDGGSQEQRVSQGHVSSSSLSLVIE